MRPRELLPAELRVPLDAGEAVHRERGSRFLALAAPAGSMEEALGVLARRRARLHDAAHHVYAARLLEEARFHDDGEPPGTGGRPVLREIERAGLYHVVVIVTRYFGGKKLGPGGLARAYGAAARVAIGRLPTACAVPGRRVVVDYGYEDTGAVMRVLARVGAERLEERHGDRAGLGVLVPAAELGGLLRRLRDATAGRVAWSVEEGSSLMVRPG